ncbi:MAG: acyl-CoA dehydrogenase, partial [Actinobacteria bacterium]
GEGLFAPTLIAFGTPEQHERFLPPILAGTEIWCQGYSEPEAGSDLANVRTRAELDGDEWVIHGQKVWTSLAHWAHWCFVLCRTDPDAPKHRGISYLLVPMHQPGIDIRPIRQLTGTSEFNEVFFDGARTPHDHVVGPVNGGWKVAMGTLAFERGASTLGQQIGFENEFAAILDAARDRGAVDDPTIRQRLVDVWMALRIQRLTALRSLSALGRGDLTPATTIARLFWGLLHQRMGELAMEVLGPSAELVEAAPYELTPLQRLFLFSRADTIYGGSAEIQRNVIGERALGLPSEPRPTSEEQSS